MDFNASFEWMLLMGTDGDILVLFLILKLITNGFFQSSKSRDFELTMFRKLSFYCICILYTTLQVEYTVCGDELLGGGPDSPSALA